MDAVTARRYARRRQRSTRTRDGDSFALDGGLNLLDTGLIIKPGELLAVENYEMGVAGGYERVGGFERFDGQTAPSDTTYYVLPFRYSATFPATMFPGAIFKTNSGADAGTVLEVVYLTEPGTNCMWQTEHVLSSLNSSLTSVDASDVPLPAPYELAVQPRGRHATQPRYDSGATSPRFISNYTEDALNDEHFVDLTLDTEDDWTTGQSVRGSLFLRQRSATDRRYVQLTLNSAIGDVQADFEDGIARLVVDLHEGEIVSSEDGIVSAEVEDYDYGNGWRRVTFLTTPLESDMTAGSSSCYLRLLSDELEEEYDGDEDYGIQVSGLHFDVGTTPPALTPYGNAIAATEDAMTGCGYLVYHDNIVPGFCGSGSLQNNIKDSAGTIIALASGNEYERDAPTIADHLRYLKEAAAAAREEIDAVPGGGAIRGVWFYNGRSYAFRDNAATGATSCKMYRSTASGWEEVTFAPHLDFDAGLPAAVASLVIGATITGGTSGATAVVKRLHLTNQNFGSSSAVGTLVTGAITGTFQNNESLLVGATPVATVNGLAYTPTWDDGGRYRFRTYNFYGASDKKRMYGVNGLNRAFEYDDVDGVLASIKTGMDTDTPTHVGVNEYMLVLGFRGGSVQNSGVGFPDRWTIVTGANELAVGDDITGFLEETFSALFVFTRNQAYQLTGNVVDSFQLKRFAREAGAIDDSVQRIGMGMHLDDRGFSNLQASDKFGNYAANTVSQKIAKLVKKLVETATVTESVIHRAGNRYRCFFSDGRFISIGVTGTKIRGHTVCDYGMVVRCACSEEDLDGRERIFFGSDDGYIYEAERGTSFDGELIRAGLKLPYHHSRSPQRNKHYHGGEIEAVVAGQATLYVRPDLNKGATRLSERDISASVAGAIYDHEMGWEGFQWDRSIEALKSFSIKTDGTNISLSIRHESDVEQPHTLRAVLYQSTPRVLKRRHQVG
jgi:hypothetical protein